MGRVKDAPPENPDALPVHIEETMRAQPPVFVAAGQKSQAWPREGYQALGECRGRFLRRKRFAGRGLRRVQKFREKTPFGKKLVLHHLARCGRFEVRAVIQIAV